jgi:PAS domain S-box-containing protein
MMLAFMRVGRPDGRFPSQLASPTNPRMALARDVAHTDSAAEFPYCRDLLCICNAAGRVLQVSHSCRRLTGYTSDELCGVMVADLVHDADLLRASRAGRRLLADGSVEEVAVRLRHKHGGWAALRWSAALDGTGTRVFAVGRPMRQERRRLRRSRAIAVLREATAERDRLHSDLHDGLLQSLTGVSLKLATAIRQLPAGAGPALAELESAAELLRHEQLELRFLIEEMKNGWQDIHAKVDVPLDQRLADFARRLYAAWNIHLLVVTSGDGELPRELRPPLLRIVQEAVVNAAKHAAATSATVRIELLPAAVLVRIADNGSGFPFHGRYDDDALRVQRKGPPVLKNRVHALGGSLEIDSTPAGSVLAITIPFPRKP